MQCRHPACFLNDLKCTWSTLEESRIPPSNPWAWKGWESSILRALALFPSPRHRKRSLLLSQPRGVVGEVSPLVFSWLHISCVSPSQPIWLIPLSFPPFASTNHKGFSSQLIWELGRETLEVPCNSINCQITVLTVLQSNFGGSFCLWTSFYSRTGSYERGMERKCLFMTVETKHCVRRMRVCVFEAVNNEIEFFFP